MGGHRVGRGLELSRVRCARGHGYGHTVRGENEKRAVPAGRRHLGEGVRGARGHSVDKEWMIGPWRRVAHFGRPGTHALARGNDVGHVALPRGLGLQRGENDAEGAAVSARAHRLQRLLQERMPVPHPHIDGLRAAEAMQSLPQRLSLPHGQLGERRAAADDLVVVRDLRDARGGDAASRRDDVEKGPDVLGLAWPSEGDQQHRVYRADSSWTMSTRAFTLSTGVSWWMPWPRLKTWPGRRAAASRICRAAVRISAGFESSTAGSRLPCTATSGPRRSQAAPSSTRQSRPMTSPPASRIKGNRVAVPTPKWMIGVPGASRSMTARLCGWTNSR